MTALPTASAEILSAKPLAPFSGATSVRGRVFTTRRPTTRQMLVLRFIHEHMVLHGVPPTLREVGAALGIRSTNGVAEHLRSIERRGLLVRQDRISRGCRVTVEGLAILGEDPSAFRDAPAAEPLGQARDESLALELRASRAENARLRLLLSRVQRASVVDLPIVLQAIRNELGE